MPRPRPYNIPMPHRRLHRSDLLALAALTAAVLVVYARVLFTPLIPASGDFLAYFAPYWELFNRTVLAGHLPLWNDYIYAGAPFQANPQTEVFYPLRWPMIFLSAEKGILVTAALHVWLAGVFGYFLARHLLKSTEHNPALPALVAALIIALNGWVTGLLLHPNQLSQPEEAWTMTVRNCPRRGGHARNAVLPVQAQMLEPLPQSMGASSVVRLCTLSALASTSADMWVDRGRHRCLFWGGDADLQWTL